MIGNPQEAHRKSIGRDSLSCTCLVRKKVYSRVGVLLVGLYSYPFYNWLSFTVDYNSTDLALPYWEYKILCVNGLGVFFANGPQTMVKGVLKQLVLTLKIYGLWTMGFLAAVRSYSESARRELVLYLGWVRGFFGVYRRIPEEASGPLREFPKNYRRNPEAEPKKA